MYNSTRSEPPAEFDQTGGRKLKGGNTRIDEVAQLVLGIEDNYRLSEEAILVL